jgi:uncharacterized protein (DUF58 family)
MKASQPNARVSLKSPWLPLLLLGLILVQATNPARVWQYMLTAILLANVVALYWAWQLRTRLSVERKLLWSWAQVGDLLHERFTLRNDSWLPVLWAEVVDHSDVPGYPRGRVETASPHSQKSWDVKAICRRRGQFRLGPWELRLGDPFGLFLVTFTFDERTDITVFPPVVRVPQMSLPRGVATGQSRSRARSRELTMDTAGVREYLPGDSLSHVHWRTTARTQQLHVKEFDLEPSGSLWILLDLDARVQAGAEEESTVEYGVILAASLSYLILRDNRPVGLFAHGADRVVMRPGVGLNHMWGLMRSLTVVQAGKGPNLAELLADWSRTAARDTTVAVITPSVDPSWLESLMHVLARGIAVSVTFLDAASFGVADIPGYEASLSSMMAALAELGVQSRVIKAGMRFEHLIPLAQRGVPRFRIGATGRAIPIAPAPASHVGP